MNKSYSMHDIATGIVNTRAAGQKGGKPKGAISPKEWLLGIPPDHTDHMVSFHSFGPNSALPVDRNTPLPLHGIVNLT